MNCKKCYNTGKIGIDSNNNIIYCQCSAGHSSAGHKLRIKNGIQTPDQKKRFDRIRQYYQELGIYIFTPRPE